MPQQTSEVVLFSTDGIEKVLSDFDFHLKQQEIDGKKIRVVTNADGLKIHCPSCQQLITESHVGTIAKGSRIVFCDNPICFSTWIGQNKI